MFLLLTNTMITLMKCCRTYSSHSFTYKDTWAKHTQTENKQYIDQKRVHLIKSPRYRLKTCFGFKYCT